MVTATPESAGVLQCYPQLKVCHKDLTRFFTSYSRPRRTTASQATRNCLVHSLPCTSHNPAHMCHEMLCEPVVRG